MIFISNFYPYRNLYFYFKSLHSEFYYLYAKKKNNNAVERIKINKIIKAMLCEW